MKTGHSSPGEQVLMAGMIMVFGVLAFGLGKPVWLTRFPFLILGLLFGFACHEFAHVLVASRLGDPTAVEQGRLTLNPLSHFDPIGTFLILTVGIGWARPVDFDPDRIRGGKWGCAQMAAAGPLANLWIAIGLFPAMWACSGLFDLSTVSSALAEIAIANLLLFGFNLLPIHPFDGGKIVEAMVPEGLSATFCRVSGLVASIVLIGSVVGFFVEKIATCILVVIAVSPLVLVFMLMVWGVRAVFRKIFLGDRCLGLIRSDRTAGACKL